MRRWRNLATILTLLPLFLEASHGYVPDDVDPAQGAVWDLRLLFPDNAAWDKEREQVESALPGLAALKGTLGVDPKSLQSGLDRISALRQRLRRLDAYAHLKADEDTTVEQNQARLQLIIGLQARFDEYTSFVRPEILALGRERIESFEKADPQLQRYQPARVDSAKTGPHADAGSRIRRSRKQRSASATGKHSRHFYVRGPSVAEHASGWRAS
jgi:hypothetical protein